MQGFGSQCLGCGVWLAPSYRESTILPSVVIMPVLDKDLISGHYAAFFAYCRIMLQGDLDVTLAF